MDSAVHHNDALTSVEGFPLIVHLWPVLELTDEQFYEFCQINRDLRIERTARGEVVIMPPAGWKTSERNSEIGMQLRIWAKREGTGVVTDSSGGFVLPNGATRSPDAAWITHARLAALTAEQRDKFLPLCPDFALELRSPTDTLTALQAKMQEYLDNGARLGLLIDPVQRRVYVYRPQAPVECLENPGAVAGDPVLPGFILDLRDIW